jgi:hypothetical protein
MSQRIASGWVVVALQLALGSFSGGRSLSITCFLCFLSDTSGRRSFRRTLGSLQAWRPRGAVQLPQSRLRRTPGQTANAYEASLGDSPRVESLLSLTIW